MVNNGINTENLATTTHSLPIRKLLQRIVCLELCKTAKRWLGMPLDKEKKKIDTSITRVTMQLYIMTRASIRAKCLIETLSSTA